MAAAAGVDLHTVAKLTRIPYKTLARWSKDWPSVGCRGRKRLYDFEAVAKAVEARQKREAEAA